YIVIGPTAGTAGCKACGDDVRPFLGNHLRTKKLPLEFQFSGGSSHEGDRVRPFLGGCLCRQQDPATVLMERGLLMGELKGAASLYQLNADLIGVPFLYIFKCSLIPRPAG
ncbi:MAG: hypothetical protein K0S07_1748, partial [Chlamydiales bacterium]|nr:hypothetical protein [Chlamydiales bacterium]